MLDRTLISTAESDHLALGATDEANLAGRIFVRGEGTRLYDHLDQVVLDFAAGILTQNVGHSHPYVTDRVIRQIKELVNVHDSSTPARDELCAKLSNVFPEYLNRFAFFSSGTEAVEAAIRAIYGYAKPERTVIAALKSGFHGKTQGSRSLVKWNIGHVDTSQYARQFNNAHCYKCPYRLNRSNCDIRCARDIAAQIRESNDLAALVFEPIQTAGGVIVPPKEYWKIIAQACVDTGVLLVADEIVSAGGRTGTFLACEQYGIKPDLVTAAKGLSSGIPFSMLAGREDIMRSGHFSSSGATSSTFGGNPVSCAAVTATLDVIQRDRLIESMPPKSQQLSDGLRSFGQKFSKVLADVRGVGLLWALEFSNEASDKKIGDRRASEFYRRCMDQGVRVGLGGNIVRVAPPLTVSELEIKQALAAMEGVLCTLS